MGLALASSQPRVAIREFAGLAIAATATVCAPIPTSWVDAVFLGCWISVMINSASIYLPPRLGRRMALAISLNSGIWAGAVISVAAPRSDLVLVLPCSLSLLPARWAYRQHKSIAVKVASSWLIAIAALAATLPFLSVTPGYLPDHLD
jgi:hypothetical protein